MITVELDIFSGRPNPQWTLTPKEESELIERVIAEPSLTRAPESAGGLGYRGFTVSVESKSKSTLEKSGLPSMFYIESKQNVDTQLALINSIEAGKMTADEVRQVAVDSIKETNQDWADYWRTHTTTESLSLDKPSTAGYQPSDIFTPNAPANLAPPEGSGSGGACGPLVLLSDTDFSFWNNGSVIRKNNCYNFASTYRSNTFAQPGRKSGVMWSSLADCSYAPGTVSYGAQADGFNTVCWDSVNEVYTCLVMWANNDYHWYRLCANGHWCHKPGQTAARNYDNSGNWIADPATCNRGPYTLVCSYRYFPYGWTVS
jgi:hypothetical protein